MKISRAFHDLGLQAHVCSYDGCQNVNIVSKEGREVLSTGPELWKCGRCRFWICKDCYESKGGNLGFCDICAAKYTREEFYRDQFQVKVPTCDEEEEEEDDDDEDKPKPAERRRKREAEEEKEKKAEDKVIVRNAGKSLEEIRAELEDISKKHWKKIGSDFDLKFKRLNLVNAIKGLYQKQTPLSQIRLDFAEFVHNVTGKEWDGLADDDDDKMYGNAEDGEEDEGDYECSSSSSSEEEGQNKKAKKDGNK